MRILLSAYACEPNKGSEPAVGWNWAVEAARQGHEVWVVTRELNRQTIENALRADRPGTISFVYYDLPSWMGGRKRATRMIQSYYHPLWQWGAFLVARNLVGKHSFDLVHHVTFVSARWPSFMGLLGLPFIFGPVAGGERAPWRLRTSYPLKGKLKDLLRDVMNAFIKIDPFMHITFSRAHKIIATSEQTLSLIPRRYQHKTAIKLAIGISPVSRDPVNTKRIPGKDTFTVLFVGQLLYLKGLHLALKAFAEFNKQVPNSRLTIIGSGPDERWLYALATQLGLGKQVSWVPWVERGDLLHEYPHHDLFLFPSLRDSGGMVVLEALAHGLPTISLDIGGPGQIVDESCGSRISTNGLSEKEVVEGLKTSLVKIAQDPRLRRQLSSGALKRAKSFDWTLKVEQIYKDVSGRLATFP